MKKTSVVMVMIGLAMGLVSIFGRSSYGADLRIVSTEVPANLYTVTVNTRLFCERYTDPMSRWSGFRCHPADIDHSIDSYRPACSGTNDFQLVSGVRLVARPDEGVSFPRPNNRSYRQNGMTDGDFLRVIDGATLVDVQFQVLCIDASATDFVR